MDFHCEEQNAVSLHITSFERARLSVRCLAAACVMFRWYYLNYPLM
jgi:hypothetical protein